MAYSKEAINLWLNHIPKVMNWSTYRQIMEWSPSGAGLHIIGKAPGFSFDKSVYWMNNRRLNVEVYLSGATNRFMTITGSAFRKCGSPYQRKHANAGSKYEKIVWICPTFNTLGRDECDAQQIPDDILKAKCAEVLGLGEFDEVTLHACVDEIIVPEAGKLIFVFHNNRRITIEWQNHSRSKSWTPEMREFARQKTLKRYHGV